MWWAGCSMLSTFLDPATAAASCGWWLVVDQVWLLWAVVLAGGEVFCAGGRSSCCGVTLGRQESGLCSLCHGQCSRMGAFISAVAWRGLLRNAIQ